MPDTFPEAIRSKLDSTLGATFLGLTFTCILYGITSLQTWMYFGYNFNDGKPLRRSVLLLWALDTMHVALLIVALYHYAVTEFGNFLNVVKPHWSLAAMEEVGLLSNLLVRALFGMKILKLGERRWYIPVFIVNTFSLFSLIVGTYFVVRGMAGESMFEVHEFSWTVWSGLATDITADAIITVSQCLLLMRMKTGLESPDSVIALLMKYSINTGLLTSLCAVTSLITFTLMTNNFIYFAFFFIYSQPCDL